MDSKRRTLRRVNSLLFSRWKITKFMIHIRSDILIVVDFLVSNWYVFMEVFLRMSNLSRIMLLDS